MNKELIENTQHIFNTPEGKEVLEYLYQYTQIDVANSPTCVSGKGESRALSHAEMAYNEGVRAVGLHIKQLMNEDLNDERYTTTNDDTRKQKPRPNYASSGKPRK